MPPFVDRQSLAVAASRVADRAHTTDGAAFRSWPPSAYRAIVVPAGSLPAPLQAASP
jgi:hypothetical protein